MTDNIDNAVIADAPVVDNAAPINTGLIADAPVTDAPIDVPAVTPADTVTLFKDSLSDEYKNDQSFATFKDADAMAKSYKNLQQMSSKKFEDLTPEEIVAMDKSFGAPESPEGYDLVSTDYLPEELNKEIANVAHELGIPVNKLNELHKRISESENNKGEILIAEQAQGIKAAEDNLKKELGASFEENITYAEKAINKYGGQELLDSLHEAKIATNPILVKAFATIGKAISEDSLVGDTKKESFELTPLEATNKLEEFTKMNDKIINGPNNANRETVLMERHRLINAANGLKV